MLNAKAYLTRTEVGLFEKRGAVCVQVLLVLLRANQFFVNW